MARVGTNKMNFLCVLVNSRPIKILPFMGAFIYGKETMPTTGDDNNVAQ